MLKRMYLYSIIIIIIIICLFNSGDNVEDVFIETAKKIYQNIQDGKYVSYLIFIAVMHLHIVLI